MVVDDRAVLVVDVDSAPVVIVVHDTVEVKVRLWDKVWAGDGVRVSIDGTGPGVSVIEWKVAKVKVIGESIVAVKIQVLVGERFGFNSGGRNRWN